MHSDFHNDQMLAKLPIQIFKLLDIENVLIEISCISVAVEKRLQISWNLVVPLCFRKDSPCTAHTKKVLNTLKHGSLRELEKLQLVGSKTAQQVVLFRY